ncbi:FliH/SctL family protein [Actibacterium lipolyticum]|uniref:Flagellar biosynthesis protein n=1 Tax=Actibacterium lipolyticum TaxID=1524263 RepID=A0A238KX08_9RHOB|nr:hypothetical protein [Actibacterium lipolyticum]SMX47364.1 hypothetical protein COL8621_03419 [Actibacterium lipolyticum]
MTQPLILEDFTPIALPSTSDDLNPEGRLEVYEEGYKAGWEDAAAAENQSQTRIALDLEKALQDLSFTYHEARTHVLNSLAPLLTLMVDQVLPDLAHRGFAQALVDVTREAAHKAADDPVELVVNPANYSSVDAVLPADLPFSITLVQDQSLGPGQAYLRLGQSEQSFDIDSVLVSISTVVSDFLGAQNEKEVKHG